MSFTAMVAIAALSPSICVSLCRLWFLATFDLIQIFGKPVEAFVPPVVVTLPLIIRLEAGLLESDLGLLAFGSEVDANEHLVIGVLIPDERVDQALPGDELAVDTMLPQLGAVGTDHQRAPFAARTLVQLDDGRGEPARSPPLFRLLRVCPRLPHYIERRVIRPFDFQLRHRVLLAHFSERVQSEI